jgi:hypothetical protein
VDDVRNSEQNDPLVYLLGRERVRLRGPVNEYKGKRLFVPHSSADASVDKFSNSKGNNALVYVLQRYRRR